MADDWFRATSIYAVLLAHDRGQWRAAVGGVVRLAFLGRPVLVGATATAVVFGGPLPSLVAGLIAVAALLGAFPTAAARSGVEGR
jgi:hypothetical protein